MGRDVYVEGRPIELIPANWDKTMICGSIDSSIWQSDQQVRRRREFSSIRLVASYLFLRPRLHYFATLTTRSEARVLIDEEDFRRLCRHAYKSRGWKYEVNATNRCDDEDDDEYLLFSGCTPTELARLYYACRNGISLDVNRETT